jgi:hypothetical protein
MSTEDDEKAKKLVLDILKLKAIGKLKVTIDKITVSPQLYEEVGKAIDAGKIAVIVQPNGLKANEAAKYFGILKFSDDMIYYDVIILRSAALTGNKGQDLPVAQAIVHECTHAGFDLLKQKMTGLQNEALAYIAGAMFLQVHMVALGGDPKKIDATKMQPIEKAAWEIAMKEIEGGSVTKEMHNALNLAIEADPDYTDVAKKPAPKDGVGRKWKVPKPAAPPPKQPPGKTQPAPGQGAHR